MLKKLINKYELSSDTRSLKENEIFFDLGSTPNCFGPYFLQALKKKPICVVTKNKKYNNIYSTKIYTVNNLLQFFRLSVIQKYKKKPNYLCAVTGTNGKTSVAHYFLQLNKLLNISCASVGTIGIYQNRKKIKSPLTTPDFLTNHKIFNQFYKNKISNAIIEASSHGLHQNRLFGFHFDCGIFTNITHDHLDYHKTKKNYFNAKMILFKKHLKKNSLVVIDTDIPEFKIISKILKQKNVTIASWGLKGNTAKIISIKKNNLSTEIKLNFLNKIYFLKTNIIGKFQLNNFLSALIACAKLGINFGKLIKISKRINNPQGRMQLIQKNKKIILIDYAHTPDALKNVLLETKNFFNKKVNIVFGCGGDRDIQKRYLMGRIAGKLAHKTYITDDNPRFENPNKIRMQIKKGCNNAIIIPSRAAAIKQAIQELKNEVLIVAGKGHENYQIINNQKKYFSDYHYCREVLNL